MADSASAVPSWRSWGQGRTFEYGAERFDGTPLRLAVLREFREAMVEGSMDHAVVAGDLGRHVAEKRLFVEVAPGCMFQRPFDALPTVHEAPSSGSILFRSNFSGGGGGIITDALQCWDSLARVGSLLQVLSFEGFIFIRPESVAADLRQLLKPGKSPKSVARE